jgi:hypothetical protein
MERGIKGMGLLKKMGCLRGAIAPLLKNNSPSITKGGGYRGRVIT